MWQTERQRATQLSVSPVKSNVSTHAAGPVSLSRAGLRTTSTISQDSNHTANNVQAHPRPVPKAVAHCAGPARCLPVKVRPRVAPRSTVPPCTHTRWKGRRQEPCSHGESRSSRPADGGSGGHSGGPGSATHTKYRSLLPQQPSVWYPFHPVSQCLERTVSSS